MSKYKLGLKPDLYDIRDYNFKAVVPEDTDNLPDCVDIRPLFPTIFSQNEQGSCTANAGVGVLEYLFHIKKNKKLTLSRQYLYNMERINDNCPLTEDNGSTMRQICKTLRKNGCCEEELFTYGNGNENIIPSDNAQTNAQQYKIGNYYRCNDLYDAKVALSKGLPVLLGLGVYEEFYKPNEQGIIPKINIRKRSYGGHAVVLVGYKTVKTLFGNKTLFIIRNSWGKSIKNENSWGYAFNNPSDDGYGDNGYAYIEESNLSNIVYDMWVITDIAKEDSGNNEDNTGDDLK